MKRIYHPYNLWEDYKLGFYDNISGKTKEQKINSVLEMFNSKELTIKYMNKVINEWTYSCEHNLTNESMNKIAYIGQAACCIYDKVPNLITMYAWKFLKPEIRERSDKIAKKTINEWMQKQKLKNTSNLGKVKDMTKEYQMKLRFN
jgi:hypothetical protein